MSTPTHGNTQTDLHGDARRNGCNALRRELHAAAGPDRIAASRTRDSIEQLRARADFFRVALELYAGQPLGYWYAELATRHDRLADDLAELADVEGIFGGAA